MFFFPEIMVERITNISKYLVDYYVFDDNSYLNAIKDFLENKPLDQPLSNFNSHCREYLGFGFLASFLPGTTAYKARKDLSSKIDEQINLLQKTARRILDSDDNGIFLFDRLKISTLLKGAVVDKLLLRPLWEILNDICGNTFRFSFINLNKKYSIEELILFILLIYKIYYYKYADEDDQKPSYRNWKEILPLFFHDLRNPLLLVDKALFFLYLLLNRILEIGSQKDEKSGLIRSTLKGLLAGIFSLIAIPLKIGIKILDIPFDLLKNIIYRPLRFVLLSAFKCCKIEPFNSIHNHNHTYRGEDYTPPPSPSFSSQNTIEGIESTEREPADADLYPNLTNNTA